MSQDTVPHEFIFYVTRHHLNVSVLLTSLESIGRRPIGRWPIGLLRAFDLCNTPLALALPTLELTHNKYTKLHHCLLSLNYYVAILPKGQSDEPRQEKDRWDSVLGVRKDRFPCYFRRGTHDGG